jgi:hypothetical protein
VINHYADIDEGFEVFDDDLERRSAEARFLKQRNPIEIPIPGGSFEVKKLTAIHLTGSARPGRYQISHPFDFEEGYLEAQGIAREVQTPGPLKTRTLSAILRWSNYGRNPTIFTVNGQ